MPRRGNKTHTSCQIPSPLPGETPEMILLCMNSSWKSDHRSESLQLGCACLQSPGAFNSRQAEESSPSSCLCTCLGLTYKQDALPFTSFVVALRWFPLKTSMLGGGVLEEIKPDISALSHLPSCTPPYYFTAYSFVFLTHEPIQRESHLSETV